MASGVLVCLLDVSGEGTYDLKFDCLAVDIDGTNLKVDSYRAEITFRVGIFGKPQEQTRLDPKMLSFQERPRVVRRTFPTPESPMRRSLKR